MISQAITGAEVQCKEIIAMSLSKGRFSTHLEFGFFGLLCRRVGSAALSSATLFIIEIELWWFGYRVRLVHQHSAVLQRIKPTYTSQGQVIALMP